MEYAGAVIICGLLIVFAILIILIGTVLAVGRIFNKGATGSAAARKKVPIAPLPAVQSGIPEETVAVITAAVAAYMEEESPGGAYAITGIQRAKGARPVWGFAGMQQNTRPF